MAFVTGFYVRNMSFTLGSNGVPFFIGFNGVLFMGFNGVPYIFTDLELYMPFFTGFNGVPYVPLFTGFNGVPYIFTNFSGKFNGVPFIFTDFKFELYMPFFTGFTPFLPFLTGLGCPQPFVALLLPGLPDGPGLAVRAEASLWQ